jgi:hypothetical protein
MRTLTVIISGVLACMAQTAVSSDNGDDTVSPKIDTMRTIADFADTSEAGRWAAVNDNVMGGISNGTMSLTEDNCLVFSGSLSLENNGGFASIRRQRTDFDIESYKGIRIRVKGDGRVYQFRVRLDKNFDGIAYKQEFQTTSDTWVEIDLPFAEFLPTYRGRIIRDAKPLVAEEIRQIGFLIADKIEGTFSLIVDNIAAYR